VRIPCRERLHFEEFVSPPLWYSIYGLTYRKDRVSFFALNDDDAPMRRNPMSLTASNNIVVMSCYQEGFNRSVCARNSLFMAELYSKTASTPFQYPSIIQRILIAKSRKFLSRSNSQNFECKLAIPCSLSSHVAQLMFQS
jgi:hypothetical protein